MNAVGRTPLLTPMVLEALEEAEGMPVSVETLSRRVYGDNPPKHYRASIRCMVQRIRQRHRRRLTVPASEGGAYRLIYRAAR